ncbi:LacI family DNA-binding transcriptional regulator [Lactiplantibacillus herbarum]|uniref:LacI family DNA-binding transcriptional regulator n=1 Tax=Lactiplantibacillus herbarum TaxID=1670446 RepID=UPI00064E29A5|nr:LacI family DNA-binding transcriptional regulator [Lactiplantibacillus herbarum]
MKPTMKDVAEQADVSKSTVSQYLNKRYSYMSSATREKIRVAIEELGYYPNQIAKSLKQKNTHVIAFICATLSSRFSLELLATIESVFQDAGYSVIIAATEDDPSKERSLINSFIARQVDGIIVFPTEENRDFYQKLQQRKFPVVFIDRLLDNVEIPSVLLDNKRAGYEATRELLKQGHQNIGIVTFPLGDNITTRVERIQGYKQALAKFNIEMNTANVISCLSNQVDTELTSLLKQKNAPTGLVLTNDILLEKTLMWVKRHHIKIPNELSLVGIDDVVFAQLFDPEITTLAQPITKIGVRAAKLLLKMLATDSSLIVEDYQYAPVLKQRNSIKSL